MKSQLIAAVRRVLKKFGIDVVKYQGDFNESLYESLFSKEVLGSKPFYNIGAGGFYHPFWTNIDYGSDWYGGRYNQKNIIIHNLMTKSPLPIDTGKAKIFYTSHTIEHIKEEAVQVFFNEAFRCLEDGGIFRITTGPDAETDFKALMNDDEDWFYWDRYSMYVKKGCYETHFHKPATSAPLSERWLHHVAGQLAPNDISPSNVKFSDKEIREAIEKYGFPDVLDYFCGLCDFQSDRPFNHISWWTHDKIFQFLQNAGFKNIYRSGYGQSSSPLMRNTVLFDSTHPQMSIYIEAVK